MSFAIATFIYSILCPEIIKLYKNYSEYYKQGQKGQDLIERLKNFKSPVGNDAWPAKEWIKLQSFIGFIMNYCNQKFTESEKKELGKNPPNNLEVLYKELIINSNQLEPAFHYVRRIAQEEQKVFRIICTIFYLLGFCLLIPVIIKNFWAVVEML